MNRRLLSSFVTLLYVSVALVFGVIHHHDHHHEHATADGHDDHCAACQWQLTANGVVPVYAVAPVVQLVVVRPLLIPASAPVSAPFFASTASRAPPVTSA